MQCPNINISYKNEEAFRWTCNSRYLKMAKWLIHIKSDIDISAENEFAFRNSFWKENVKVIKWLLKIKPTINISAENECVFIHSQINRKYSKVSKYILQQKPNNYYLFATKTK